MMIEEEVARRTREAEMRLWREHASKAKELVRSPVHLGSSLKRTSRCRKRKQRVASSFWKRKNYGKVKISRTRNGL